ncbi:MAG: hypothetical protein WAM82_12635 [Thermoanaerobaculia bacterium]
MSKNKFPGLSGFLLPVLLLSPALASAIEIKNYPGKSAGTGCPPRASKEK